MLEQKLSYESPKKRSWLRNLVLYGTVGLAALVGGCEGCGEKNEVSFLSGKDIYVVREDGSNKRNITNTPDEEETNYLWSGDGKRIAFNVIRHHEIFIINRDGTGLQKPSPTDLYNAAPSWSPDGTKIAFYAMSKLFVMNSDGSNVKQINGDIDLPIKWSPDGKMILTPSYATHPHQHIFIFLPAGPLLHDIEVAGPGTSWFSKSKLIIEKGEYWPQLGRGNYIKSNLKIYDLDTKQQTDLTSNIDGNFKSRPSLSPNGNQIAFLVDSDMYIIDVNGSNPKKLVGNVNDTPLWSSDGKKLLFKKDNDVYITDLSGRVTNITNTPNEEEKEPQWVP